MALRFVERKTDVRQLAFKSAAAPGPANPNVSATSTAPSSTATTTHQEPPALAPGPTVYAQPQRTIRNSKSLNAHAQPFTSSPSRSPPPYKPQSRAKQWHQRREKEDEIFLNSLPPESPIVSCTKAPSYVQFAGIESPKVSDFLDARDLYRRQLGLPLHVKPKAIASISYDQLLALPMSRANKQLLRMAIDWCTNAELYEEILMRPLPPGARTSGRSTMTTADEELLLAVSKWRLSEQADIRIMSNAFFVIEALKLRRRAILEPLLNDRIISADVPSITLPQRKEIRRLLSRYRYFCGLDASAFYDQFGLSENVSSFFGVAGRFVQRVLPMGFKPACFVAQQTSLSLLDFPMDGEARAYIDNYLFFGPSKAAILTAVDTFLARCDTAGVIINDRDSIKVYGTSPEEGVTCSPFDCLGERYDLQHSTRTITSSTVEKLQLAVAVVKRQTSELIPCRRLAAVYGILFYATSTFTYELSPKRFFDSIYFLRQMSRVASRTSWDAVAPRLPAAAYDQTQAWLLAALAQSPVPLHTSSPEGEPEIQITVDACEAGWGAVIETAAGTQQLVAYPWTQQDVAAGGLWSSVVTEPLAALRGALVGVPAGTKHVRIVTDHEPLVFAASRGWAASRNYNTMLCRLAECFPETTFSWVHIAGPKNRADPLSRGLAGWSGLWPDEEVRVACHLPTVRFGVATCSMPSVKVGG